MSNRFKFTAEQVAELEDAYCTYTDDGKAHRRIQVVMLRAQGTRVKAVTAATRACSSTITDFTNRYLEEGIPGLLKTKHKGNYRFLTKEETLEFLAKFEEDAAAGKLITTNEMFEAYQERIGHTANRNAFISMLHRFGWRKVKPRPHHPKQVDAETIEASKKLTTKSKKQENGYCMTWIHETSL